MLKQKEQEDQLQREKELKRQKKLEEKLKKKEEEEQARLLQIEQMRIQDQKRQEELLNILVRLRCPLNHQKRKDQESEELTRKYEMEEQKRKREEIEKQNQMEVEKKLLEEKQMKKQKKLEKQKQEEEERQRKFQSDLLLLQQERKNIESLISSSTAPTAPTHQDVPKKEVTAKEKQEFSQLFDFLTSISLLDYFFAFSNNGFTTLDLIKEMDESGIRFSYFYQFLRFGGDHYFYSRS